MRTITHIVIHCTAGSPHQSVESVQAWWKKLGWKNPGYHYLIDCAGTAHELQEEAKPTNGVAGHNANSIHVSYIGGVKDGKACDTRSNSQIASMIMLLRELHSRYPDANIVGHRDLSPDRNRNGIIENWEYIKLCPSFDVASWLETTTILKPKN